MLTKEETTWEGEIQHSAIFGFIPASFVQNKKQKRFLFLGIEDKTVSDRAVVEEENQGRRGSAKKKKKSWFRLLNEMIFPCDGEELARVKPVKMVSQEKIVTANTRI